MQLRAFILQSRRCLPAPPSNNNKKGTDMGKKNAGNRDPRLVRIQRGGTLNDKIHQSLALWAAKCAERVLFLFEDQCHDDLRPAEAIEAARAWAHGDITMMQAREFAYAAHAAARETKSAAREAARAAGHAVATAHMADHELGAAFYALRAIKAANPDDPEKMTEEREWQREVLTSDIRELVLDDMCRRAKKFQNIFSDDSF